MIDLDYKLDLNDILIQDNIAEIINEDDLKTIGKAVVEGFREDTDSRSEWMERNERALDLALQVAEVKNTPWPNAANIKYPLLSTAALQFSARAYPALIPGPNVVKGRVIGFDPDGSKVGKAIRISKHMSYQLFEEMEDWEEEMDRLCMILPILGTVFKKTYYDPVLGRNVSELVMPESLVVNYWAKGLETAVRKTHEINMTTNDIYERVSTGLYLDVDLDEPKQSDERSGQRRSGLTDTQTDHPYTILEQHCYLDLDDDGYAEPYIITVEESSEQVLRIIKRFEMEDIVLNAGKVLRIKATEYFTKFSFIPSPDGGFYDIGFGTLLGPINDTINTTINQLLDAGTLANLQGGFVSKGIRLKGGPIKFTPGEWKQVSTTGDDLRQGIVPLPIKEPSNVLFQLLATMVTAGEKLSSVTDIMTGDIPGQNTKATVALNAVEQGMKVFNGIYKRVHRSLKKEFKKLYALNAKHLPLRSYFTILDMELAAPISRNDYDVGDVDVIPYSDPNVATEAQKISKLEALGQLLQLGTIDPMEFTMRYIEATEQPQPEKLLAQPKGPDPETQLKMAEQQLKEFEAQTKRQIEGAKVRIADKLASSKISKEEIDSIVALIQVSIDKEVAEKDVQEAKMKAKEVKSDT